uniref:NNMT/PNMT/TEMT family protein n=1 Tax=Panagrellus redivivus TaxID=6233 RepID=A0A7E4W5J0_PANRE
MAAEKKLRVFQPKDYESEFDPEAYLHFYYSSKSLDDGTRLSLFALPMFAHMIRARVPEEKRQSLIDVGAGPTVYSAISFREIVKRVYLTDYVDKSLTMLDDWMTQRTLFSWEKAIRVIARTEGTHIGTEKDVNAIEEQARKVVEAGGIYKADVRKPEVVLPTDGLPAPVDQLFDVMVSVFCLESACATHDEYVESLNNMLRLLRPGGYFVLGSVIDDVIYNSGLSLVGDSKLFSLLNLNEEFIEDTLVAAGMNISTLHKYSLSNDGVAFFLIAKNE